MNFVAALEYPAGKSVLLKKGTEDPLKGFHLFRG